MPRRCVLQLTSLHTLALERTALLNVARLFRERRGGRCRTLRLAPRWRLLLQRRPSITASASCSQNCAELRIARGARRLARRSPRARKKVSVYAPPRGGRRSTRSPEVPPPVALRGVWLWPCLCPLSPHLPCRTHSITTAHGASMTHQSRRCAAPPRGARREQRKAFATGVRRHRSSVGGQPVRCPSCTLFAGQIQRRGRGPFPWPLQHPEAFRPKPGIQMTLSPLHAKGSVHA